MSVQSALPYEVHCRIDDAWLEANSGDKNAVFECYNRDVPQEYNARLRVQRPRGIMIKRNSTDDTLNYATVRGYLWGENSKDADDYDLVLDSPYPLAFKRVYAQGTTARGVKILG